MPRIETEVRLDFKDVLIRPKRSTLKSRSQVDVQREFRFRNSKRTWAGVVRASIALPSLYPALLRSNRSLVACLSSP